MEKEAPTINNVSEFVGKEHTHHLVQEQHISFEVFSCEYYFFCYIYFGLYEIQICVSF